MQLPQYIKDGFTFFRSKVSVDSYLGDSFVLEGSKMRKSIDYINAKSIKCLMINPGYTNLTNMEFLQEVPLIEKIVILTDEVDPSGLSSLKHLRELRIGRTTGKLDLANFPNLEVLGIEYSKHVVNLNLCDKLSWLSINKYNKVDLQELSCLTILKYLTLYKTKIVNTKGMANMPLLLEFHIDAARNLVSLDGLNESNANLKVIDIYNAPRLTDYKTLSLLNSIEKIRFAKTGEAQNINFIKQQSNLHMAAIGMRVADGNVKCLLNVPEAYLLDFPHNNIKSKQLKNLDNNAQN